MTNEKLGLILQWKLPASEWVIRGSSPTMANVDWLDGGTPKPTDADIAAWETDFDAQDIAKALELENKIENAKAIKALVIWANQRANATATQWNAFRGIVAAAASLADIKTGVANSTQNVATTTPAEAKADILTIYRSLP